MDKDKTDAVLRIVLEYHRTIKSENKDFPDWEYREMLCIDRKSETLEHEQQINAESTVGRQYQIKDSVPALLDEFNPDTLFAKVAGNPPGTIFNPLKTREYKLTVEYQKRAKKEISGTFDRDGLPEDFPAFMGAVNNFMMSFGFGTIFESSVYAKRLRRKGELIVCSVIFQEGGKRYDYLSDDDSLEVGEIVTVPAGPDSHSSMAQIVRIRYFEPDKLPHKGELKQIIGRGSLNQKT